MLQEYNNILKTIDEKITSTSLQDIPKLFEEIPLPLFGELLLQEQNQFRNIKSYLPHMADEEVQVNWTGSHGRVLLGQSVAFVRAVIDFYRVRTGKDNLSNIDFLDFGCGWGRLIRLFYKYVPETQIYGVDAWDLSIQKCEEFNVRANFGLVDYLCKEIPFDKKFDLIIAFSVFTHLSKRAANDALSAIRRAIKDDGIFVLTVRQFDYWQMHAESWDKSISVNDLVKQHVNEGFAFVPHGRTPIDGDITYGDTSISIEFINANWKEWNVIDYKINTIDPYQSLVFLQPK